jgi:hypothetical protein
MKLEIDKLIKQYSPKSFGRLASCRLELKTFLKKWNETRNCSSIGEQFFCIHYNIEPPLCICGNKLLFKTYVKGYWSTCGDKKCKSKSQSSKLSNFWQNNPEVKKTMIQNQRNTCLERYGTENIMQNSGKLLEIRGKLKKETGYSSPLENPIVQEKCKTSIRKKYGVNHPFQSEIIQKKARETYLEKHNGKLMTEARKKLMELTEGKNPFELEINKEKSRITNFKKFGSKYASQNPIIKNKIQNSVMSRFGVINPAQAEVIKQKIKNTNIQKYGVFNHSQKNYSILAKTILEDKNLFESNLRTLGVAGLANYLDISPTTILRTHHRFGLDIIQHCTSSYEVEISEYLMKNNILFEQNSRKIIPPNEIDIFLPEFNLAIEVDGLYWHSNIFKEDKNYHYNKTAKCQKKGIHLIHIFEDEWLNKKDICLNILDRCLNINITKLMARKCQIREISNQTTRDFLNENHLQGWTPASICIGLFYENELVHLMTFKKARYNKNIAWELLRTASKKHFRIVGGNQKLWKYFLNQFNPTSVVSYCDRRWFNGNVYAILNFCLEKNGKPTYWYTDYKQRWHRSSFFKQKCINYAIISDSTLKESYLQTLTENQITKEILGLDRIWDCGQDTWIWKNNINLEN